MISLKSILLEQGDNANGSIPRVLFVGDSQTASPYSYAKKLINTGAVTGKIVAEVGASMAKMNSFFNSNYKPGEYDIVSILGGNNDAGNVNFDTNSYKNIINTATAGGSKVIIITAPSMKFINKSIYPKAYPSMDKIPIWQKSLRSDNVLVVDAYLLLNNKSYYVKDGLHLTEMAQNALAQAWLNVAKNIEPSMPEVDIATSKDGVIKFGDIGQYVKQMQSRLQQLNYSVGPEKDDGIFGPHTLEGVKSFQRNNNLPDNGILDKKGIELLNSSNAKASTDSNDSSSLNNTEPANISLGAGQKATAKQIIDFFVKKGLTKEQSIGIVANLQAESGLKTGAIGDSGTSVGLAQWHAERKDRMVSWVKSKNMDPESVDGQLEYLWEELNTTEKRALSAIKASNTSEEAAAAFCKMFERPANPERQAMNRAAIASSLELQFNTNMA